MLTNEQRDKVIAEARTWIGTPYKGHSCLKGCGADCGQVLYGIYRACGLLPVVELPTDYSLQVAWHMASTEYVELIDRFFRPITEAEVLPGDLVVYKLGLAYAHGALIVRWPDFVLQAEMNHDFSGAHGTKTPIFKRAPRVFRTLKDEYCAGGF